MSISDRALGAPSSSLRLWLAAIRPKTLSMAVVPVITGSALAWSIQGQINPVILLAVVAASMFIQAGTNLYNDAADFQSGNDSPARLGPPRMSAMGLLSARQVKSASLTAFILAALLGLWLSWIGGWPILLLGSISILSGYAYSAGPRPISYTPFGEVFVIAFFGIAATGGSYYLQAGYLSPSALIIGAALGAFAAAVLLTNNTRDRHEDKLSGRKTLAILCGRRPVTGIYAFLVLAPYLLLALNLYAFPGLANLWPGFLSLPLSILLALRFARAEASAYNQVLVQTAQTQLVFALLVCLGLLAF
ncbi:MAG TPA: 1,4-dihydroxy-2-naphthoate octaprenyltransferase [Rhizobiales bacterium]|nr:1,4-dihydroxy-2-naphthoate octaprenyltransferase [Hyphomicrobiales bacterium]